MRLFGTARRRSWPAAAPAEKPGVWGALPELNWNPLVAAG